MTVTWDRVLNGVKAVIAYFEKEIEARRGVPAGDDLMSFALTAEVDGRKLSHDELVALFFNLGLAGLDTGLRTHGAYFSASC